MDNIIAWIPLQHGYHYNMDTTTTWIPLQHGYHYNMDTTTTWIPLQHGLTYQGLTPKTTLNHWPKVKHTLSQSQVIMMNMYRAVYPLCNNDILIEPLINV
jgi:hypothetical protein